MQFVMITGRTIPQGSAVERKHSEEYRKEASTCHMHPVDMMDLELEDGSRVRVRGKDQAVVMQVSAAPWLNRGHIFVCLGPYANHLVTGETRSTGMPDFKNTPVIVEPTDDTVPTVAALMRACGGCPYEG
jgi:formylmethanofuran dehydrogenase subunit D